VPQPDAGPTSAQRWARGENDPDAMTPDPDFLERLRAELRSGRRWLDRAIVLGYAIVAGLAIVGISIASDWAFSGFHWLFSRWPWAVLAVTPLLTGGIVWATLRFFPGAGGSGIQHVKAAIDPALAPGKQSAFVSMRLTLAKIGLTVAGFLGGLSIGREGPSVQVAAGVMQHARRWLSPGSSIDARALLIAGGAAGIAGAFNAPLAGVVFAIEELSGRLEARSSGLIMAAIVLAGLVAVSVFGNQSYFGVIRVPRLGWDALGPGLAIAVLGGAAGGLFSRLLIASLTGAPGRLNRWRARFPVRFAMACGLAIAVIGLASGGATFGSGSEAVKEMLQGGERMTPISTLLKFVATWLTAWSGAPGGIFAPSLAIGAGIGDAVAHFAATDLGPALIAIGMAAFLAGVTQAPLTAFIIVMEMIDGHAMVLSLMTAAMLASLISHMITRPLYEAMAQYLVAMANGAKPADPNPPQDPTSR